MDSEVAAYQEERLKQLASQPNTTVYTTKYDNKHDAWPVQKIRPICERIAKRVSTEFDDDISDFQLRKACLQGDEEVRQFQKHHPQLYWQLTDRKMIADQRFRSALGAFFTVMEKVEKGEVKAGEEADGLVNGAILSMLRTDNGGS